MTQQYLCGELSFLLGQLEAAADDEQRDEFKRLRRRVETESQASLVPVAAEALRVSDQRCWACLARGDVAGFSRQAALGAQLWEFCVCARLGARAG